MVTDEWAEQAFCLWLSSARAIGDMLTEGGDVTEEQMQTIQVPTLIVWGQEDKVFSVDNAHRLAQDIQGSELHVIEKSGHLPQLEQTAAFLDAVSGFLSRTTPRK